MSSTKGPNSPDFLPCQSEGFPNPVRERNFITILDRILCFQLRPARINENAQSPGRNFNTCQIPLFQMPLIQSLLGKGRFPVLS